MTNYSKANSTSTSAAQMIRGGFAGVIGVFLVIILALCPYTFAQGTGGTS